MPDAPAGELIGLTQSEIRARLGATRSDGALHFTTLSLEEGVLVAEGDGRHLFADPNPCRGGSLRLLGSVESQIWIAEMQFRDGRLAHMRGHDGAAIAPAQRVGFVCRSNAPSPTETEMLTMPILLPLMVVGVGPMIVASEVLKATNDDSDVRDHALGAVRLGAALPGGTDAFVAAHEPVARLLRAEGEDADVAIRLYLDRGGAETRNMLVVEVRNGVVARIVARPNQFCRVAPDQYLACRRSA